MHIAFGSDNGYAQHLAVTLASLLTHLRPGIIPHIHVVTDGINADNREKIESLQSIRPFMIDYLVVSADDFSHFPNNWEHVSYATWFRLRLPSLLPHLDKVLYMDIDTVVDDDITPLWETPLSPDDWIAGALELEVGSDFLKTIGLGPDDVYINAGVLLMNLVALRSHDFEQKSVDFIASYRDSITYVDQDVVNHVCRGHIKVVDPRYNMVFSRFYHAHRLKHYKSCYSLQTLKEALSHPAIIHFSGGQKPWFFACRHNLAPLYMHYIKLTPWRHYQYPDRTFKIMKSKYLFFVRQWFKQLGRT